jgi:uncharacterized protein (DUF952 family)
VSDIQITYHLTPLDVWNAQSSGAFYEPEAYAREGFIHCTDGEYRVIEVGNRYYTGDERGYCLLSVDRSRVKSPVIYEDEEQVYPHIYGPLGTDAVVEVRRMLRAEDGSFVGVGEAIHGS